MALIVCGGGHSAIKSKEQAMDHIKTEIESCLDCWNGMPFAYQLDENGNFIGDDDIQDGE